MHHNAHDVQAFGMAAQNLGGELCVFFVIVEFHWVLPHQGSSLSAIRCCLQLLRNWRRLRVGPGDIGGATVYSAS
jgi:hypothetical protein